ncbi:MAG: type 2 isopentenyl-diphosphate Delta-isomerase [Candidatus Thorarchaeota archaeon]
MEVDYNSAIEDHLKKNNVTSDRKLAHLQICLEHDVQARNVTTGLEDITLIHRATTDLNLDEIDLETKIFGKKLALPLICSGMTGGHDFAKKLNLFLSQAAHQTRIGMGVGSQRAALEKADVRDSFVVVREQAPEALVIGNIGAGQVALGLTEDEFNRIISMVRATAIAIHFNPLQEALQLEGDTHLANLHDKVAKLVKQSSVPVIAKEVGGGFSLSDILKIKSMGFQAIDIQGVGGTSWPGVESIRTTSPTLKAAGEIFWDWGVPTVLSTILAANHFDGIIIGSGGVRNGLDVAKLLALGADAAGMAIPFLFATQQQSSEAVVNFIMDIAFQLRLACYLTGSQNLEELKTTPLLISGETAETLIKYGIDPKTYLHRL